MGKWNIAAQISAVALLLAACGSGGGGGSSDNPPAARNSVVTAVKQAVSVDICPNGGIQVDAGIDNNGNSVLDASEVDSTQYVCNGEDGSNGATALVSVVTEPAGINCAYGGKKVSVGLDADADGVLDPGEVTSVDYICNGADGSNGTSGSNGVSTLMLITDELAGTDCSAGGKKIEVGKDTNSNGVLDSTEIESTDYVCNGSDGANGVTWVNVTGLSQQASANTGYMANSTSQVVITLPTSTSLNIGDTIRVSGVGTGGWTVAQNDGQSIITSALPETIGSVWTARESSRSWQSVASSSDGTKLAAVVYGGQIYTSTDSGVTWTARESDRNWWSVASSSDGTKLVAAPWGGQIYTSSDSGVTWTARNPWGYWHSVASSSDGTKLVAAVNGGQIYTSTDSGVTWTARESSRNWHSVASSSDGTKLVATVSSGQLYTSTDSGITWTARDSTRYWYSVASSSDGTKLVAAAWSGQIYTSTDSGVTWTARDSSRYWFSVASSSDGTKLVAAVNGGQIYTSTDSGVTWTACESNRSWHSVASSSDGTKLVAAAYNGQLYTSIPAAISNTTVGAAGSLTGGQYDAVELQYIGSDTFNILSHEGDLLVQ